MRTWIGRLGAVVALLVSVVAVPSPASAQSTSVLVGVMVRHMTVEEKVGQLFVVEVYGQDATTVTPEAAAANRRLYGVDTPAEGVAVVFRLVAPATAMPGNMALGASRSQAAARRSAQVIGTELAAVGINQDYAPVADVNVNPANPVIGVRSVGEDPQLVSRLVSAQVDGYHDGGVATVAKHFPGHGDTAVDSHFGLPEVTHTRAQLEAIDLPPFRAAIRTGVDTIMTAHVVLRSIDPSGAPATMSRPILTGLLREELRYDGLIVTDALDMGGATGTYPPNVAPVEAFKAGADQLVLAPQLDVAYNAVLAAVRSGEISKRRLD